MYKWPVATGINSNTKFEFSFEFLGEFYFIYEYVIIQMPNNRLRRSLIWLTWGKQSCFHVSVRVWPDVIFDAYTLPLCVSKPFYFFNNKDKIVSRMEGLFPNNDFVTLSLKLKSFLSTYLLKEWLYLPQKNKKNASFLNILIFVLVVVVLMPNLRIHVSATCEMH